MNDLSRLEPRAIWSCFSEICAIPHPSHHEEALADWALARAKARGFETRRDRAGNVLVRKPASPGLEASPGIVFQAHLDMVGQKESSFDHDFTRDPILPRLDPEDPAWLRASGTTLGADDGIGVAAGFALLEDEGLRHGPLELLLTLNEEDGMTGARELEPGFLSGRYLVNLDGEREEELCVGSAGSRRVLFEFTEDPVRPPEGLIWLRVSVSGLKGGHSGGDIHLGRASAIRVLVDLLAPEDSLLLGSLDGGSIPNAIARDATALVGCPSSDLDALRARLESRAAAAKVAFRAADPGLRVALAEAPAPEACLDAEASARILTTLAAMPDGLVAMLEGMADVARLSSNLGALETRLLPAPPRIAISGKLLARAAFDAERRGLVDSIEAALRRGRAAVDLRPELAAWSPDLSSPLLAAARRAWRETRGVEPEVRATHGGLECSLIRASHPGLDVISVGPTIRFPHSPDEAVLIESVGRFLGCARRLVSVVGAGSH